MLNLDGVLRKREAYRGDLEAFLGSPSPQNHAANLMTLGDGSLGCVWFGGTQEGMADISVHFARLKPGSSVWEKTVKLQDDITRSEQNPILFPVPNGPLWLLYTSQKSGHQNTAVVRKRVSLDHGESWSEAETLIADAGTFVRQPIKVLPNGAWLLGTFLCRTEGGVKWSGDNDVSVMRISTDQGKTWSAISVPESVGCVHMNVVEAHDGSLVAFYRSRWADFIYLSRSQDLGKTWSKPEPTVLPNNNSSIQAINLADGRIAMVYNQSSAENATERRVSLYDEIEDDDGEASSVGYGNKSGRKAFWGAPRAPLMFAISDDGGRSWEEKYLIEDGDGYCMTNNSVEQKNRELSYPSVHQSSDGRVHIAFTYHRQAIKHVVLDV